MLDKTVQYKQVLDQLKDARTPIRKPIVKKGTIQIGIVETTPVVWEDKLLRFEWIRNNNWGPIAGVTQEIGYYRFMDMENEEPYCPPFAMDHAFGCCYTEDHVMYVQGVRGIGGGNIIDCYQSTDLIHWEQNMGITLPYGYQIFNTSVCKDPDGYTMAIEIYKEDDAIVGSPYTCFFAKSTDLMNWKLLPMEEYVYSRERYTACPTIRYYDGYYYIVNLELAPLYRAVPYIVRSKTLKEFTYEAGVVNPIMFFSDEDKVLYNPDKFTSDQKDYILNAANNNNSDVDFCEYNGKTIITYSWGNQLGKEFLAFAEYDGGEEEFLKSFFE